jgi:hypothetical protein
VVPCTASQGSSKPSGQQQAALDRKLDQAIEETFPASDPISITPLHPESPLPGSGG